MADTKKAAGAETKDLNPPPAPAEMFTAPPVKVEPEFSDDGYVIERPSPNGELPSYFAQTETGPAWTWDKSKATIFKKKEDAAKLVAEKTEKAPAGAAAGEDAKAVKATN